jgi:hypothetical protein
MAIDLLVFILRFIVEVIFIELTCLVARFVLRVGGLVMQIASFGGMQAAPMDVPPHEFNWFYCRRSENGLIEVESTVAGGIGLVVCFICLAVFLHFF